MACRSTMQNTDVVAAWSATNRRRAPRYVPSVSSPEGWMPEKTRGTGGDRRRRATGARACSANDTGVMSIGAMSYEVTTPVYEGPFDLLLHLILREQVEL